MRDASEAYEMAVKEANTRHRELQAAKKDVLLSTRELLARSDAVLKAVSLSYFQAFHAVANPLPVYVSSQVENQNLYSLTRTQNGSSSLQFRCKERK